MDDSLKGKGKDDARRNAEAAADQGRRTASVADADYRRAAEEYSKAVAAEEATWYCWQPALLPSPWPMLLVNGCAD